jgi:hypothetical protein
VLDFPRARGDFGAEGQAMPASAFAEFALDNGTVGSISVADQGHQVHDLTPAEVSRGIAEGRYLLVGPADQDRLTIP